MPKPIRHYTLVAISCALLIACGGGGGSSSNNTLPQQNASEAGKSNLCAQMPPQSANGVQLKPSSKLGNQYVRSGNDINDLNQFTNQIRSELGLAQLSIDPAVTMAAGSHSIYMANNQILAHEETPGLAGFTAIQPHDRIDFFYTGALTYSGEIVSSMSGRGTSGESSIRALFDAPLHRIVMLSEYALMGSGYATSSRGVAYATQNYANYQPDIADFEVVAYPYADAQQIRTSWVDTETPDPLEGTPFSRQTVGYPITVQANFGSKLTLGQFKVYKNCQTEVALTARSHEKDPNIVHNPNALVAVPHLRLAAQTQYTVWVTGYYTSGSQSLIPFDLRWRFTTR
jgi:uncharacterized protein YkwD